jgi:uncharacterized protein (DUF302 family)
MHYALSTTVSAGFDETLAATRAQLAEVGFGVLTEIDMAATLKSKIGVDIAPQVILGACRPPLAHAALQAEPSIGLLLPCNVVVRDAGDGVAQVELDYVTPRFRDFSPGEFVYRSSGLFRGKGIRRIVTPPGMVNPYYQRLGFTQEGDHWVADLP